MAAKPHEWHRGTVTQCMDQRVTVSHKVGGWSDTIYMADNQAFSPGTVVTFQLAAQRTSGGKGKRKYWKGRSCRAVVNESFVRKSLCGSMSHTDASKIINAFAQKNKGLEGEEQYIAAWVKHVGEHKDDPEMTSLRQTLSTVNGTLFADVFMTTLQWRGVPDEEARQLSDRLCEGELSTTPEKAVDRWLSEPYSPYLVGLALATRDNLYMASGRTDRDDVRIRHLVHRILTQHENTTGATFMAVEDMNSRLIGDHSLIGINVKKLICSSDNYSPLPATKFAHVRDPSLHMEEDIVQHMDVHKAEKGLIKYWAATNDRQESPDVSAFTQGLNDLQVAALRMVLTYRVTCITGRPGRGKTFLTTRICDAWHKIHGGEVLAVSSYHQPLKNLKAAFTESKGYHPHDFRTIASASHSPGPILCACCPHSSGEKRRRTADHPPSLLIIEEAGVSTMLGLFKMFEKVLEPERECRMANVHILMLGDSDQLKPIGPGRPMTNFIKLLPHRVTVLMENMRSISPNLNANVDRAIVGDQNFTTGDDFVWRRDVFRLKDQDMHQFAKAFLQDFNHDNDVVLTPSNVDRHIFNTMLHNRHLQQLVPDKAHRQRLEELPHFASERFVCGTRVVCIKTDKEATGKDKVTNALLGVVCVDAGGRYVDAGDTGKFPFDSKLWNLAYCLTAHKAQGSEYHTVYVYSFNDFFIQRDWVYTAVSRAKLKAVYLVPAQQHMSVMRKSPKESQSRMETLARRIMDTETPHDDHHSTINQSP